LLFLKQQQIKFQRAKWRLLTTTTTAAAAAAALLFFFFFTIFNSFIACININHLLDEVGKQASKGKNGAISEMKKVNINVNLELYDWI